MEKINEEMVAEALKKMGYTPEEIDEVAKDEVRNLMDIASRLTEATTVNLEEECPTIPDE